MLGGVRPGQLEASIAPRRPGCSRAAISTGPCIRSAKFRGRCGGGTAASPPSHQQCRRQQHGLALPQRDENFRDRRRRPECPRRAAYAAANPTATAAAAAISVRAATTSPPRWMTARAADGRVHLPRPIGAGGGLLLLAPSVADGSRAVSTAAPLMSRLMPARKCRMRSSMRSAAAVIGCRAPARSAASGAADGRRQRAPVRLGQRGERKGERGWWKVADLGRDLGAGAEDEQVAFERRQLKGRRQHVERGRRRHRASGLMRRVLQHLGWRDRVRCDIRRLAARRGARSEMPARAPERPRVVPSGTRFASAQAGGVAAVMGWSPTDRKTGRSDRSSADYQHRRPGDARGKCRPARSSLKT